MEVEQKTVIVRVIDRICGPVAEPSAGCRTKHLARDTDHAAPKLCMLLAIFIITLETVRREATEPATDGAAFAQLESDGGVCDRRRQFAQLVVTAPDLALAPGMKARVDLRHFALVAQEVSMAQHLAHILVPHHSQRPRGRLRLEAVLQVVTAPERQHLHWVNFDAVALCYRSRGVEVLRKRRAELPVTGQPLHEALDV